MNLVVRNLKKNFGDTQAVKDLSFTLSPGEIMGFVGPNGAGKTTTLRILATLEEPTAGQVNLGEESVLDVPELARKIVGFVPDSLPLQNDITVHEYLDFFARAYEIKRAKRIPLIEELEDFTNLKGIRGKLLNDLSKGMKQRVSLARALIHDPKFLLMDEPAAGLDPRARIELRELLKVLAQQGKGIFISSHILSELAEICTSAVFIEQGRLLRAGSMEEITSHESEHRRLIIRPVEHIEVLAHKLLLMPGIENATIHGRSVEVEFAGGEAEAAELLKELINRDIPIVEFKFKAQNLESVFMDITKGDVQ
jgi:ABC-2 type transport system ATP-binding protein